MSRTNFPRQSSFNHRAKSLAEARSVHDFVEGVCAATRLPQRAVEELWSAVVVGLSATPSALDLAVDLTLPRHLLLEVRVGDDLPAHTAFAIALGELMRVDLGDDIAVRAALTKAWAKFEQLAKDAADLEEGFGCSRGMAWRSVRATKELKRPGLLKKMTEIAQLAGRMHGALRSVMRSREAKLPHEVTGAERGGQVERLLPAQHAKLTVPELADAEAMRVLKGDADVRKMVGHVTGPRGPLVLMLDESSSMHDEAGRLGRNTWAKAAALALARIALTEGRTVRCVHFSGATSAHEVKDQAALLDMCASFLGGGTAFVPALRAAHKEAQDLKCDADVVAITDGERDPREDPELTRILDQMDKDGIELITVGIGQELDPGFPLRARAKRYVFAHDQDLALRHASVRLATELTSAVAPRGQAN